MKKIITIIICCFCLHTMQAQNKIVTTQPRLLYNYFLYTNTILDIQHLQTILPEGARLQVTDDIERVKKSELIQFKNKEDGIDRFWYVNNTILKPCTLQVYQANQLMQEILFWPNAETFSIDTKLLKQSNYRFKILSNDYLLAEKEIIRQ